MKESSCNQHTDPIARMVRDMSAEEFVDWLVEYKGLPAEAAENVAMNLREQYRWHRLQGRLDRNTTAALIAEMLLMRRAPKTLETPAKIPGTDSTRVDALEQLLKATDAMAPLERAKLMLDAKAVIEHYNRIVEGIDKNRLRIDGREADFVITIEDYEILRNVAMREVEIADAVTDRARLNQLKQLLKACPHAVITFNDDHDREYDIGMVPVGFSIRVDGCEPLASAGHTLRAAIGNLPD